MNLSIEIHGSNHLPVFIIAVALQNTDDSYLSEIDLFLVRCKYYC